MQPPLSDPGTVPSRSPADRAVLRILGLVLAGFGGAYAGWLVLLGHEMNVAGFFYGGLAGGAAALIAAKRLLSGLVFHNVANTLLLLLVLLVGWDATVALSRPRLPVPSRQKRAYSYATAQGNPRLFRNWWRHFVLEWEGLFRAVKVPDPRGVLPFKLRPGARMTFANSQVSINSLGFRDREFRRQKHGQFRIVALGESTTMGITLEPSDRPWPAVLESLIRADPDTPGPVQVINAGIAAYTLADGLVRLREDVLALQPDLLISYHGYNGFDFLRGSTPMLKERAPERVRRPSALVGMLEYRWKLGRFRQRNFQPDPAPDELVRLTGGMHQSHYARLYRELIRLSGQHGIPLVLASFNMAVNASSPPEVIEFYRGGFPSVNYSIMANRVHNLLIGELARQHDGVRFVDTSDGLDGAHDRYIDLVHFTQPGRDRLAANLYAGIRDLLTGAAKRREPPAGTAP